MLLLFMVTAIQTLDRHGKKQKQRVSWWSCCLVAKLCPTLCDYVDCSPPGSPSMRFPRQECWSRLPFPSPGDLPNPGIEPMSPALQVDSLPLSHQGSPPCWCLVVLRFGAFTTVAWIQSLVGELRSPKLCVMVKNK